jgi:hypothetical protein
MTVPSSPPALKRSIRVEDATLPLPTLKANDTEAPCCLALGTTLEVVSWVMACWGTHCCQQSKVEGADEWNLRSDIKRLVPVFTHRRKLQGTSQ